MSLNPFDGKRRSPAPLLRERVAINPGFFHRLSEQAPDLTLMEIRIATLLRLSMRPVEIANHLGISYHTVENHRSKMKKKLGLSPDHNIDSYLATLS